LRPLARALGLLPLANSYFRPLSENSRWISVSVFQLLACGFAQRAELGRGEGFVGGEEPAVAVTGNTVEKTETRKVIVEETEERRKITI